MLNIKNLQINVLLFLCADVTSAHVVLSFWATMQTEVKVLLGIAQPTEDFHKLANQNRRGIQ